MSMVSAFAVASSVGVIHIERMHKGGRRQAKCVRLGTRGMGGFKTAYVRKKTLLWTTKSQNFFFIYTKEAITLPFIIVYRKV